MNLDDLEKALVQLDAIGPATTKDPAIARAIEKLRKQLLKKGVKTLLDDFILKGLVDLIEIHGLSKKQTFKEFGKMKWVSEARARKLWFDTMKHHPEKIEDLRQYHAYRLLSDLLIWVKGDQTEKFPLTSTMLRLKNHEPELFEWAKTIAVMDFHGVKHADIKPDYKKSDEVQEMDLLSFQKEIASSL